MKICLSVLFGFWILCPNVFAASEFCLSNMGKSITGNNPISQFCVSMDKPSIYLKLKTSSQTITYNITKASYGMCGPIIAYLYCYSYQFELQKPGSSSRVIVKGEIKSSDEDVTMTATAAPIEGWSVNGFQYVDSQYVRRMFGLLNIQN